MKSTHSAAAEPMISPSLSSSLRWIWVRGGGGGGQESDCVGGYVHMTSAKFSGFRPPPSPFSVPNSCNLPSFGQKLPNPSPLSAQQTSYEHRPLCRFLCPTLLRAAAVWVAAERVKGGEWGKSKQTWGAAGGRACGQVILVC